MEEVERTFMITDDHNEILARAIPDPDLACLFMKAYYEKFYNEPTALTITPEDYFEIDEKEKGKQIVPRI